VLVWWVLFPPPPQQKFVEHDEQLAVATVATVNRGLSRKKKHTGSGSDPEKSGDDDKRKLSNRLSADKYRKKRKTYVDSLENEVSLLGQSLAEKDQVIAALDAENQALKQQLSIWQRMSAMAVPVMDSKEPLGGPRKTGVLLCALCAIFVALHPSIGGTPDGLMNGLVSPWNILSERIPPQKLFKETFSEPHEAPPIHVSTTGDPPPFASPFGRVGRSICSIETVFYEDDSEEEWVFEDEWDGEYEDFEVVYVNNTDEWTVDEQLIYSNNSTKSYTLTPLIV